jgi:hypothetical protein
MRLTDLEPEFLRCEERMADVSVAVGDPATWRARGAPSEVVNRLQQYKRRVDTLAEAQSVWFLCPACFQKNGGAKGTHMVEVGFHGRGLLDHQSSRSRAGGPSRWHVDGTGLHDLTLSPSVDCGCWHGFITNGEAT